MFADQAKGLLEELVSTIEDIARFVEVVDRESAEAVSTKDATEKIRDDSVSQFNLASRISNANDPDALEEFKKILEDYYTFAELASGRT